MSRVVRRRRFAIAISTPDEVGTVGALLMGLNGGFVTGRDSLVDGEGTAAEIRHEWLKRQRTRNAQAEPSRARFAHAFAPPQARVAG